jgi:hypothetical protein
MPTALNFGSRMFLRCAGEFMKASWMESQLGPSPTFSPSNCHTTETILARLGVWKMVPALAISWEWRRAL